MKTKSGLSQEWLKGIACITMLVDHIGAIFFPAEMGLRMIGRIAFPIYCFLIAEGAHYTRDPKAYALRLGLGAIWAEVPFDLALFGGLTPAHQSVMLTLLLGYGAVCWMKKSVLVIPLFALAAELLGTDYGGMGVLLIVLFAVTRELPRRWLWQAVGMVFLCQSGARIYIGSVLVYVELFALLALIPIGLYSGKKSTWNGMIQRLFYTFYPLHLAILGIIRILR